MQEIRFGIIGCGRIAPRHAEAIKINDKAKLVAVCDIIEERAMNFLKDYSAEAYYTNYRDLLNNPDIDVVSICTPSGMHAQMGVYAARAGKHVLVEKPMALSLKDADALIKACEDNGVLLAVCHQNRYNPAVRKLRKAIEDGRFGKLTHASAVVRWFRPQDYYDQASWRGTWAMDGGCLMNQSIHNIDLLLWMMGEAESVFGYTSTNLRKIEAEDVGVAVVRFKNGALGVIEASTTVYPKNLEETLSIFGEKGTVVLGGIAVNKIEEWRFADVDSNEESEVRETSEEVTSVYGFGHNALIEELIEAICQKRQHSIDGHEGRKALELVLAIYHAARFRKEVDLPLIEKFYLGLEPK